LTENHRKIICLNLWKIFGHDPRRTLDIATANGITKEKLLEETNHVLAIKDVSFEVKENEIFVIMGLSGSGKSTLVRCINRLIEPTGGTILVDGTDISQMNDYELKELRRHKLSMVFQNFGLLPHRSVLDNITFGLEIRGEDKKTRIEKGIQALELVGLKGWEKSRIYELSGGMQQRVGLARALAVGPEILLMDEPFSALDPLIRRQMQDEFLNLRSVVKKTVLFITHDLTEALKLGDRIAIMKDGEIVQIGNPEEIVGKPADDYVSEFVKDVPRGKVVLARSIMQEPQVIVRSEQDIEAVIKEMASNRATVAFVLGHFGRLKGIMTMKDAIQAVRAGTVKAVDAAREEFPFTTPDAPLEESLHLVAESNIPVAVLDDERQLLGVITRPTLIRAMHTDNGSAS
jgi:glycine betaine/proline transport system ATP-binding protein